MHACDILKSYLQALSPISEPTWERIIPLFKETTLNAGEHFATDGETATQLGFLETGVMRAYYRNEDGKEYNKHFFVGPCFAGAYASLISGRINQINQQALTSCRLSVASYAAFRELYASCPDLERAARVLAEWFFVQKEQKEIEIVLLDARARYRIFQHEFPALEQQIPQYHIASYLGISPTQLSRIRSKYR